LGIGHIELDEVRVDSVTDDNGRELELLRDEPTTTVSTGRDSETQSPEPQSPEPVDCETAGCEFFDCEFFGREEAG
jgi:hypothetical protein